MLPSTLTKLTLGSAESEQLQSLAQLSSLLISLPLALQSVSAAIF